jgi:hypothetical protein
LLKRLLKRWSVCVGLFSLLLILPSFAAEPIIKRTAGLKTTGWHDVYLTGKRICKGCQLEDLGNERVKLTNEQGLSSEHWSTEIIGVYYKPRQRRFWLQFVENINPHAAQALFPEAVDAAKLNYPYYVYPPASR